MKSEKLNILLLTGINPYTNSGIWGYDIFKSLTRYGHSVLLLTKDYDAQFEPGMKSVYGMRKWKNILSSFSWKKIQNKLERKINPNPDYYMFNSHEKYNHIPINKIKALIPKQIDVIIYLFPHSFLDSKNLYELNQLTQAPIFVMPVDMGTFTGGCHYANDCEGYQKNCGNCPGLYSKNNQDLSYQNIQYKKQYLSKTTIYTLANTWTANLMKKSCLYREKPNFKVDVVVNDEEFHPGNREEAKNFFSVPLDKQIIFFGVAYIENKRKGLAFLVDALAQLYSELDTHERSTIGIVIAGNLKEEIKSLFHFDVYIIGHLSHIDLVKAYQMADVYVSPSIQDAGPMMVIQSMMCGTPVVAFEMGNAIDFIVDGETGYKVPLYDTVGLKEGIRSVLKKTPAEKTEMAEKCREIAFKKSSYQAFEEKFVSICQLAQIKKSL